MEKIKKINEKLAQLNGNSPFVVTLYDKGTDEAVNSYPFDTEDEAIKWAQTAYKGGNDYYIEVWEQDETGGYGNSGAPIYKSDE